MKNWIYYKDQDPVNLGVIEKVSKKDFVGIIIAFKAGANTIHWRFESENERDSVFETIKSQMTEMELFDPPFDKND